MMSRNEKDLGILGFREMIRRSPTRIELRLDDLQEYEAMRKEQEARKEAERRSGLPTIPTPPAWGGKIPQTEIQERIGYVPQPPVQPAQPRPNI